MNRSSVRAAREGGRGRWGRGRGGGGGEGEGVGETVK